ncbi:MAG: squalene/phytoene synthase family protein [Alphaproteobacteria bacterium]|nr:squalene/phytoene synthase family protein [Alphaproteobacteria bacterium]
MDDIKQIRKSINVCRAIAKKANANFSYAASLLPLKKRDFFYATYAAMRVIDDNVDEKFLILSSDNRKKYRSSYLNMLNDWLYQVCNSDSQHLNGPLDANIVTSIQHTCGRSNMGTNPWKNLAEALKGDIEERTMETWDDFLKYCEGATVSPATIFIYLSAATYNANEGYKYCLDKDPRYFAKNLAIYCYIVHILRDLSKDAKKTPRLVTIPLEILQDAELDRESIYQELKNKSKKINALAKNLITRAEVYKCKGHIALTELIPKLGARESMALTGLIRVYDHLFGLAKENTFNLLANGPALESKVRGEILKKDSIIT